MTDKEKEVLCVPLQVWALQGMLAVVVGKDGINSTKSLVIIA